MQFFDGCWRNLSITIILIFPINNFKIMGTMSTGCYIKFLIVNAYTFGDVWLGHIQYVILFAMNVFKSFIFILQGVAHEILTLLNKIYAIASMAATWLWSFRPTGKGPTFSAKELFNNSISIWLPNCIIEHS